VLILVGCIESAVDSELITIQPVSTHIKLVTEDRQVFSPTPRTVDLMVTAVAFTPDQPNRESRPDTPRPATRTLPSLTPTIPSQGEDPAIRPGIRPEEAIMMRDPELGPDPPVDWRPPPVPVPHALHPNDHYWLARPIASDQRNYGLEWYTYGNEPLLEEARPYRVHHGIDFPNSQGTTVFSASSGTVVWAGPLANTRDGVNYYGNTVIILHDWQWLNQPVYSLYAHTLELFVEVGDYVEQGQLIAGVGASGEVSGPHMHFEVRVGVNDYYHTVNPALWLAPYEGWGTLAGRFIDRRGRAIHGATVTVRPINVNTYAEVSARHQTTYSPGTINSDEIWQENFVVANLPAGEYVVTLLTADEQFRKTVTIKPEQTNYIVIQADFEWTPSPTPTPTPSPTSTATTTATVTVTPTP
jgi:murein DD-endopeptidase MepM/ murein hydrolase activator NlpD